MARELTYEERREAERPNVEAAFRWLESQPHDGWAREMGIGVVEFDGSLWWQQDANPIERWVTYRRVVDGIECLVVLTVNATSDWDVKIKRTMRGANIAGHTSYDRRCFTRRGVDCESCQLVPVGFEYKGEHDYHDLASLLAGEQARCVEAAARRKSMVPVPGLPFNVQPTWFATTAKDLDTGRHVHLMPHGMGTGYTLRKGMPSRSRGETRATEALEAAIGRAPIAIATFDAD